MKGTIGGSEKPTSWGWTLCAKSIGNVSESFGDIASVFASGPDASSPVPASRTTSRRGQHETEVLVLAGDDVSFPDHHSDDLLLQEKTLPRDAGRTARPRPSPPGYPLPGMALRKEAIRLTRARHHPKQNRNPQGLRFPI